MLRPRSFLLVTLGVLLLAALFSALRLPLGRAAAASGPVLVVAAHEDDEALGFAGIISQAKAAGRRVYVAIATNGEGWPLGGPIQTSYCGAAVGSASYAAFNGVRRDGETITAMGVLGLSWSAALASTEVVFLGYPDRGLPEVAAATTPYTQDMAGLHRTFAEDNDGSRSTCNGDFRYLLSGRHSDYTKADLAADMDSLIALVRPTDVYTHGAIDSNGDHAEVFRQVANALARSGLTARLHATLIHQEQGDCPDEWPNPSLQSVGGVETARFTPTIDFTAPPTPACVDSTTLDWGSWGPPNEWVDVPAAMQSTDESANPKWQTLLKYQSQSPGGWFRTFVKRREIFWTRDFGAVPAPTCPTGQYAAQYYANRHLMSDPAFVRCEGAIGYDWGSGGPGGGVGVDNFSTRWVGQFNFAGGSTTFTVRADDGIRLWVDGTLLVDAWVDQLATTYNVAQTLSAGTHTVKVEYYENAGPALAQVSWQPTTPPANTSPPSVSGTAQQGQTLGASTGTWSGSLPISYAYQWRRCDTAGAACADITGATASTYTLQSADVGATIRVRVTASNAAGSATADSAQTAVVTAAPKTSTLTFSVLASGDDGEVASNNMGGAGTYPPTTASDVTTNATSFGVRRAGPLFGGYEVRVGLLRFDTSALPDGTTITAAKLRLYVTSRASVDGRNLVAEWYSASNWPIDAADYTATAASTAHAGTAIGSLLVNAQNELTLQNLGSISSTGSTGLRLHVSGGQPTGENGLWIASLEDPSLPEPQLVVTYTVP